MRGLRGCSVAAALAVGFGLAAGTPLRAVDSVTADPPSAHAAGTGTAKGSIIDTVTTAPSPPRLLYFSGGDLWQRGLALHGGVLWSPRGLDQPGPVFKLLTASGQYRYHAGDDGNGFGGGDVQGVMGLASAMAGWRLRRGALIVTLLGGPDLQYHRLSRPDPGNRLSGLHAGLRVEADLWYQPAERWMAHASASVSTIGPGYWTRVAAGRYLAAGFWVGPEFIGLGGPTHHEARAGLHVTSLRLGPAEWTFGGGLTVDIAGRSGGYVRFGAITRR